MNATAAINKAEDRVRATIERHDQLAAGINPDDLGDAERAYLDNLTDGLAAAVSLVAALRARITELEESTNAAG
jgi:hypothetical protein